MSIAHNCQQETQSLIPIIRTSDFQVLKLSGKLVHLPGLPDNLEHPLKTSNLATSVQRSSSLYLSVLEFPGSWQSTLNWEVRVRSVRVQRGTLKLTLPNLRAKDFTWAERARTETQYGGGT